jgi:hypothetical protein
MLEKTYHTSTGCKIHLQATQDIELEAARRIIEVDEYELSAIKKTFGPSNI